MQTLQEGLIQAPLSPHKQINMEFLKDLRVHQ